MGPQGERGAPGEPGTCNDLFYVDATGQVVAPVCAPYIIDSQGYVWRVDEEMGSPTYESTLPSESTTLTDLASLVYFETSDCSGPAFMSFMVAPRMPFIVRGNYQVRADDAASSLRQFRSKWREDGTCDGFAGRPPVEEALAFPMGPELELTPPASFRGPLHIERRP